MNEFKQAYVITLLAIVCLAAGFAGGYLVKSVQAASSQNWPILEQAYQILLDHGLQEAPDTKALEYGMIKGMVQAYDDPYTIFTEPVQHELESNTLQGSFGGIGVRLGRDGEGHVVLYPLPDSPAQEAGVLENDRLLEVMDLTITNSTTDEEVQAALRGPVGELVKITVARAPDYQPLVLSIKRAEIPLPSVTWHIDPDASTLGVIEINVIAASTPDEIETAVKDLESRGAEAYILDLRDNYGGLLTAGVDTARLFLADGVVIDQQFRGEPVETFRVEKPGLFIDLPLAVLVNENTASAAEIIAGAIKANRRAKLVGRPTYGKNTIQLVFDLKDGSSLHVTAAQWWIPGMDAGSQDKGVEPDIEVNAQDQGSSPDLTAQAAADLLLSSK